MIATLFILLISTLLPDPQTPNYYPGLTSAREASKKEQKEMVIFFTDKACSTCEAAWAAFIKDDKATSRYVSTKMDVQDFDGGIFFDLLDLNTTPSWVVLNPNGTEKERWEGGWKDASGQPIPLQTERVVAKPESKKEKTSEQPATAKQIIVDNSQTSNSGPNPVPKNELNTSGKFESGYYLQAGYFGSEANANKLMADLKSKGFSDFVIQTEPKEGATFFRIVSNSFANEEAALAEQQRLSAAEIKTSLKSR